MGLNFYLLLNMIKMYVFSWQAVIHKYWSIQSSKVLFLCAPRLMTKRSQPKQFVLQSNVGLEVLKVLPLKSLEYFDMQKQASIMFGTFQDWIFSQILQVSL